MGNAEITMVKYTVKNIRLEKELTLTQLSKLSGVSVTQINDIERNLKHPTVPVLFKIAKALEVEIKQLYYIVTLNCDYFLF